MYVMSESRQFGGRKKRSRNGNERGKNGRMPKNETSGWIRKVVNNTRCEANDNVRGVISNLNG